MENLNEIFSKNITRLRNSHHLTQFELGEKLNYSDKAVSRWERGEAIPDAKVLVQLGDLFGVTVDDLLKNDEVASTTALTDKQYKDNKVLISTISCIGVWTLALLIFVILYMCNITYWTVFSYALPVSLIVAVVFSAIWGNKKTTFWVVSALVWSIILSVYFAFFEFNFWILFLIGVPTQIIVALGFRIKGRK
jgi:transcriptional regulator with XRE-family HTH domain